MSESGTEQPKMEACENCGRVIGKLETPWVHGDHTVCRECWERLSTESSAPSSPGLPVRSIQASSQPARPTVDPVLLAVARESRARDEQWSGGQLMGYAMLLAIASVVIAGFLVLLLSTLLYYVALNNGDDPSRADDSLGFPISAIFFIVAGIGWAVAAILFIAGIIRLGVHK